jgi:hypothetical protein
MRRKQNRGVRQDISTPSTALRATEALEQQVRAHPVVQEAMRLFDARIVAITQEGERPAGEQQQLCFSSPGEAGRGVATALHRPPQV